MIDGSVETGASVGIQTNHVQYHLKSMAGWMLKVVSVFVEELVRPLVYCPPPTMANTSNRETRKRETPMASVEHSDLEPEAFHHMPLGVPAEDLDKKDFPRPAPRLKGDLGNIMLLMFLYILQGIPLGLAASIPILLQSRKVPYTEQAVFSFIFWPFSLKLLWAPLVDSLYVRWFGRRKTWLIPTQYLIGLFMVVLSFRIQGIMEDGKVDVLYLTVIFFMLNFLAATQDIAVDGWALTMLSRDNVGWASTCNSVGQNAGHFVGYALFLTLESAQFCNTYLRRQPESEGIVTLESFLYFWGIVFFVTTTVVGVLKPEQADPEVDPEQGIVDTYRTLIKIIRLPSVMSYALILLTAKIAFSAANAITDLKLIESGMPKERLALFAVPMMPVEIVLPFMISKYTHGPRPLAVFLMAYPYRVLLGPLCAFLVYWSHHIQKTPGEFPWYFYVVTLMMYATHQVCSSLMSVAQMAFHAKISDPVIGGTYMTLLNTVSNLGARWTKTLSLFLMDHVTFKTCDITDQSCGFKESAAVCTESGGKCITTLDGYYILISVCFVIGFLWLAWRRDNVRQLDNLPASVWKYAHQPCLSSVKIMPNNRPSSV